MPQCCTFAPENRCRISPALTLGLITGASVMGAVFARASATTGIGAALPEAVAAGMQVTFGVAAGLIVAALVIAVGGRALAARPALAGAPS